MVNTLGLVILLLTSILSLRAQTSVAGVGFSAPSSWQSMTPSSPMRAAQWSIAASRAGLEAGEVVVFYFGPGQGGDANANIQRWLKTLSTPTGARVEGEIKEAKVAGMKVTYVVGYGTYASGMPLAGVPPVPRPEYGLAGVVIETAQGNVFVRLTGPQALVKAQLPALRRFVESAKVVK